MTTVCGYFNLCGNRSVWMDRRRSASYVWLEPIEVNRSGFDVESYIRAYGVPLYTDQTRGDEIW